MFCLLWLLSWSLIKADFPPFSDSQLPARRQVMITENTNGQQVIFPIHFGPTGTEAWESVFISMMDFNFIEFIFGDCFCNGDTFIINEYALDTGNSKTEKVVPLATITRICEGYEEDPRDCLGAFRYAFYRDSFDGDFGSQVNVTFSTLKSPYGGGIAYFGYATYQL